jgi:glycine betaine transporter
MSVEIDQNIPHEHPEEPHEVRAVDREAGVDYTVFGVAMAITVGFVLWGVVAPTSLADTATTVLNATIDATGWIYVLSTFGFVALMLMLAVSRYGRIRLGRDDERPEFSTMSWISMMFATGMGIGLIFWGWPSRSPTC